MNTRKILFAVAAVILLLLLLFFLIRGLPLALFSYAGITRYYAEFDSCRDELAMLVEYLENYQETNSPTYLSVSSGGKLHHFGVGYLPISGQLQQAIQTIQQDGFICKDGALDAIRFKENRIQFDIPNGTYALVYSPDGRPKYLHAPDETDTILVRHIEGPWYHVSRVS